ncbi:purine and uridine phosphorylase [Aspergillus ellipticus CBS 707.79]|uniref:Purine and uridine phosphorylase n=1 Tax=Aspergillus ellipticus CBS 707.79 TaxID=1448320 RepID=A0A319CZN4_9EURO|nr:purine and uridine phosphorylase [Aspergillus ellipticus CBS 707.79]
MGDTGDGLTQRELKRPKYEPVQDSTRSLARKTFTHANYTVGWICPLQIELVAALEMLDEEHAKLPQQPADHNVYHLGSISGRNVVIAGMWQAGNSTAATVAAQMRMTFPNIRYGLLVGTGGGVPVVTEQGMVRLGHVVVSKPTGQSSGAIQYDRGKAHDSILLRTGALAPPPPVLLLAAEALAAQLARSREDPLLQNVQRFDTSLPGLRCYQFPDGIYPSDQWITVHRGTIASGEIVLKDAVKRDLLTQDNEILCFEMECAGALSDFPCLVIRGISNYCDSHKNDQWQGFASAAAAAYARQLFFHVPIDQASFVPADDLETKRIVERSDYDERRKIVEWISSTNSTTFQVEFLAQISEGTGQWLLDATKFGDWMKQKGVLFCPGIPGAGETILASIVINYLQKTFATKAHVGIAYIFCDYREKSNQNVTSILAAILKQLVQSIETVPENLNTLYAALQATKSSPQRDEVIEVLELVVSSFSRVYLVIDALDECSESDGTRNAVISHILNLQETCNMNLFATSRFIPDITARLEKFSTVEVRASDGDVARYAKGRIHEFNCVRKSPALSELVVSSITETSDGM